MHKVISHLLVTFLIIALSSTSHSETNPKETRSGTESSNEVAIHVYYEQESDSWRLQYELPSMVPQIAFSRPSKVDRQNIFQINKTKFNWHTENGQLLIKSKDGSLFDSLELSFNSNYQVPQGDYNLNVQFSDGSLLLYSNHLSLAASSHDKTEKKRPLNRYYFNAPKQHIAFMGQYQKGSAQWLESDNGSYIYFGNIKPIEDKNLVAFIDPNLPPWVLKQTEATLPQLFSFYQEKTKQKLNFKPVIFFNYADQEQSFSNYSGGVLSGLMQLTLNGRNWQQKTPQLEQQLFQFLTHETAHFWNGQMFYNVNQKQAWLAEGAADAFAFFSMYELGLLNDNELQAKFELAINECVLNKGNEALNQSMQIGRYRNYYTCGASIALASHAALQKHNPHRSLFDLWAILFKENIKDKSYNQDEYFSVLKKLSGQTNTADLISQFVNEAETNNLNAVVNWFENTNIKLQISDNSLEQPKFRQQYWGKQAIIELMNMHCLGHSLYQQQDHVKTAAMRHCHVFTEDMSIYYLNNKHLVNEGIDAYRILQSSCQTKQALLLKDQNQTPLMELPCTRPIAELPPYLKLKLTQPLVPTTALSE
ncbi:hypothetical protein [Agaribacterium sp. ZY112]|uniref:hypothetical protein n=1 Tax=Agaribacterium sp. ZY112 TaxID=3233574 RepID=UPI003523AE1F